MQSNREGAGDGLLYGFRKIITEVQTPCHCKGACWSGPFSKSLFNCFFNRSLRRSGCETARENSRVVVNDGHIARVNHTITIDVSYQVSACKNIRIIVNR